MTLEEKLKKIADHYKLRVQLMKFAEECAEFSASVHKSDYYSWLCEQSGLARKRGKEDYFIGKSVEAIDHKYEELADVLVMSKQIEYLINKNDSFKERIEELMAEKVDRQLNRIEEEENAKA